MKRSFSKVLRALVVTAGLSLSLAGGMSFAERAPMAPLPSPSGVDIPPLSVPANPNALANGTQAQAQPANPSIFTSANSDPYNYVSIPDKEASVLIQRAGQQWRVIRNGVITIYGGWLLALAFFGVVAMYTIKGSIKLHEPMSGVKIKRFSAFDRLVHWLMAFSFLALAITGLLILYGKYFVMSVMGAPAYGSFLDVCKNIHNFTGPLFTITIVVFFLLFVSKNIPGKGDLNWIVNFGGILNGKHVPAGFFNFGEKFWFWFGMTFLGLTISASGFVLDMIVPFMTIEYTRGTMQIANIIHSSAAILMSALAMGHIYIGTIGMQGSIDGMKTGYVDATWAKEHHELWYDDLNKKG